MVGQVVRNLPNLYTARQYALLIGKPKSQVSYLLSKGRIPEAQKVDGRWIIPENAVILERDFRRDPNMIQYAKLFSEIPEIDTSVELPEKTWPVSPGKPEVEKVKVPGYARIVEEVGLGKGKIYTLTGVHPLTQNKMLRGEPVIPSVVVRLSVGLEREVGDFLRP